MGLDKSLPFEQHKKKISKSTMDVDTPMQEVAAPAPAAKKSPVKKAPVKKAKKPRNPNAKPKAPTAAAMIINTLIAVPSRKGLSAKKLIDLIKKNNAGVKVNDLAVKKALKKLIADKKIVKPAGVGLAGSFKISPEESARVKKAARAKTSAAKKKATSRRKAAPKKAKKAKKAAKKPAKKAAKKPAKKAKKPAKKAKKAKK